MMRWLIPTCFVVAAPMLGVDQRPAHTMSPPALGTSRGDAGFDARQDLNGDGHINVLDVRLSHGAPADPPAAGGGVLTEIILVDDDLTSADAGGTATVLLKLFNNETPLFGYSLAVRAVPLSGATGTINVNVAATNLYAVQNLILADPNGAPIDNDFLVIQPWSGTGVFINANTDDGSTVLASLDVNDVFAEVHFDVSPDAFGIFTLDLGPATALSDGDGFAVPFIFCGGRIAVGIAVPSPSDLDGDGTVGPADLAILLSEWGPCGDPTDCPADADCDSAVTSTDLAQLLADWG